MQRMALGKRSLWWFQTVAFLVCLTLLAGCASKATKRGTGFAANPEQFYGQPMTEVEERALLDKRVYYFGYDRYDVDAQDILSVYAHARRALTEGRNLRIEGHTDQRGSREYNMALGERRAKAVAELMSLKGVPSDQVAVVSYGKERPVVEGEGEADWARNRRAEVIYE